MDTKHNTMNDWSQFSAANLAYVHEVFEQYREDADSVDAQWQALFNQWGPPPELVDNGITETAETAPDFVKSDAVLVADMMKKAVAAERMAQQIRTYGHLAADIDPLNQERTTLEQLVFDADGIEEEDLRMLPPEIVWPHDTSGMESAWDAMMRLKQIYTNTLTFQFAHVHEEEERNWLYEMAETGGAYFTFGKEERIELLRRLVKVEEFEQFIHRTFLGQKRFSVEGLDVLIPMVEEAVFEGIQDGAKHINIGMAHRGRLNMLAHVLGKPYEAIFTEFQHAPNKELVPSEGSIGLNYGWTGDVKYHLGADLKLDKEARRIHLKLANNPSHLEFVNPVIQGYTRAAQEDRNERGNPVQNTELAFAIHIHGDAAFPGEGIVAETLNLSRLTGYQTGGSIHIIANNQIGFTTMMKDARSTKYASDLAKGFEIPIVHVNADHPEACMAAVHLAVEYRKRFKKDFLIDLVGYRRFGHNESDDPSATQSLLYEKIKQHPSIRKQYTQALLQEGVVTEDFVKQMEDEVRERLQHALEKVKAAEELLSQASHSKTVNTKQSAVQEAAAWPSVKSVSVESLQQFHEELQQWPAGFHVYPKLARILQRRSETFIEEGKVDWALAELLAFATILHEKTPIRMTGQDSERGTFAHRHFVLYDEQTGETFTPLKSFPSAKASFAIHNSPLSEAAVLGFEYGYNVYEHEIMVIWEAQFGDFANAAQVIIDQFLTSGQAKWRQHSDLVLLLPHGYEGQGPEHSSARLERFLQSSADHNCTVAYVTTAAQYYHLLRRQAMIVGTEKARPLIVMTPKSLLRNPHTVSDVKELSEGRFLPIMDGMDREQDESDVERVILCSGKIAVDLLEALEILRNKGERPAPLHIVRIEQLYPFPKQDLAEKLRSFSKLRQLVWVQEEPKNMGAWNFIEPLLREILPEQATLQYIGRKAQASPAEGSPDAHKRNQAKIITAALML